MVFEVLPAIDLAGGRLARFTAERPVAVDAHGGHPLAAAHRAIEAGARWLHVVDMDLAFGTAGLNFNQDPPHGLADAIMANQKVDQTMLDRLMSKAANHINLLTAPVTLDRTYDFEEREFEQVLEYIRMNPTTEGLVDNPAEWPWLHVAAQ